MYNMQELHLYLFSFSARVTLVSFTSSTVSLHSSINLSANLFLYLQFLLSKYSLKSHDLLHSHSQLLGFHTYSIQIRLYQLILYIHICIYFYYNDVYYYKQLHLIHIHIYMFHAILCFLFH